MVTPPTESLSVNQLMMPKHIAIVMDGNGRWAKRRFLPRMAGHAKGVEAVKKIVEACIERNIKFLTVFAFSSENWHRPAEEVSFLMKLFASSMEKEAEKLHASGIRLKVAGDLTRFDSVLQDMIAQAEQKTAHNSRLTLTVCANYGGHWDVLQAVQKMMLANPEKKEFSPEQLAAHLSLAHAPDPDLFIRTGGEQRISNFLLWQLAYTELYFTEKYWPDFDAASLDEAIASYQLRERRFGQISEQLTV